MALQLPASVCQPASLHAKGSTSTWVQAPNIGSSLEVEAPTWVKLLNPPAAFSFDEALLLCQYSDEQWLMWIPDYGEAVLSTREFCSL